MSNITRLLNDYAAQLDKLPAAAWKHGNGAGDYAMQFVESRLRAMVIEMRALADLHRASEAA